MAALSADRSVAVRSGEELDLPRLERYLGEQLAAESVANLRVRQFPSGFSNLTYLIESKGGPSGSAARQWVLRRPPFGSKVASAHDMSREYRILTGLAGSFGKVPKPILFCDDPAVLGAPFYLMERVEGTILRGTMPAEERPDLSQMGHIARGFVATLAELHAVDYRGCGLGDLGKPEGYARRQVKGWSKRYAAAGSEELPAMERAARWLGENLPPEPGAAGAALIHNDFKYDNLVLTPEPMPTVRAVLDWEMATLGDPLMDLGTVLAYWCEEGDPPEILAASLSPTTLPGNPGRAELAERYAKASGRDLGDLVFYYAFGLFYYRYRRGHTQDPRFAGLGAVVRVCGQMAAQAIDRRRIDRLFD